MNETFAETEQAIAEIPDPSPAPRVEPIITSQRNPGELEELMRVRDDAKDIERAALKHSATSAKIFFKELFGLTADALNSPEEEIEDKRDMKRAEELSASADPKEHTEGVLLMQELPMEEMKHNDQVDLDLRAAEAQGTMEAKIEATKPDKQKAAAQRLAMADLRPEDKLRRLANGQLYDPVDLIHEFANAEIKRQATS